MDKYEQLGSVYPLSGKYIIDGKKMQFQLDNEVGDEKIVEFEIKGDLLRYVTANLGDPRIREGTEFLHNEVMGEGDSISFGAIILGSIIFQVGLYNLGIYTIILVIKALRLYIKKNS